MTDRPPNPPICEIQNTTLLRECDEARAEVKRLRDRELDDFTVTADGLDAALDARDAAVRERDEARAEARQWMDEALKARQERDGLNRRLGEVSYVVAPGEAWAASAFLPAGRAPGRGCSEGEAERRALDDSEAGDD